MKITTSILSLLALSTFFLSSCGDGGEEEKEIITTIATLNATAEDTLVDPPTRVEAPAHGGKFVFRNDSMHDFAGGQVIYLNDSLMNSTLRVVVDYWTKSSNPMKGDGFAAAFQTETEMIQWFNFDLIYYGAKPNEWVHIKDSITITPEMYNKPGVLFKFFSYCPNKKAIVDSDDITITVKKIETITEE